MNEIIDMVVVFDDIEAITYHTFVQSLLENSTISTRFLPLNITPLDGCNQSHYNWSNNFIFTKFLVLYLMNFRGWVLYADGDILSFEDMKNFYIKKRQVCCSGSKTRLLDKI
mgnify:CR=1 FL=1